MEEQDIILQHKRKRKKHKIILAIESIVTIIIALIIIITYFTLTKNDYNKYSEKAKVNYKVYLKENECHKFGIHKGSHNLHTLSVVSSLNLLV